jgi:hypothetical protein
MKLHLSLRGFWMVALALCCLSGIAVAQNRIDTATQQMGRQDLRARLQTPAAQEISSLYEDEDKDVGPQNVIRQKPRHNWLEASTDVQFGSTSNVYLTETGKTDSSMMISTVQLAVTPPAWQVLGGQFSARAGYRHQKFNYGIASEKFNHLIASGRSESTINDSDFDISTMFVQGHYLILEQWLVGGGMDYNRLLNSKDGSYTEFYSELAPNLSVQRSFELSKKSAISANIGVAGHISYLDPSYLVPSDSFDRVDESATVTYARELLSQLGFQTFYRAQFTQYTRNHVRKDLTQTLGVVLAYSLCKEASLRAFANFEGRSSEDPDIADYQKVDTGMGLSLRIQF